MRDRFEEREKKWNLAKTIPVNEIRREGGEKLLKRERERISEKGEFFGLVAYQPL